jgi:DNA-binding transcriptional ArsR family regulator
MTKIDEILTAVGYPIRREILRKLSDRPRRAGELARGFSVSRPAVWKHAQILEHAGLIKAVKSGRERMYQLAPDARAAMQTAVTQVEELSAFWDVAFQAFKRYAEEKNNDYTFSQHSDVSD